MKKFEKILKYCTDEDYRWVINAINGRYDSLDDVNYLKMMYLHKTKKQLDLENPKSLNEKFQWLKIYDRKEIQTTLVDKYNVKEYVASLIGAEYIIPTLGVWDDPNQINFDLLPNQFVLKCTHNSGKALCVCKNKNDLNQKKVIKKFKKALKENYYYPYREWPYKNVVPRVIAEEYLFNNDNSPLVDYKFYCYGGEPRYYMYSIGEAEHNVRNHKFDMDGNSIDHLFKSKPALDPNKIKLPSNINEMISIVKVLCKNHKHVRVDLYNIDGKIYFGEMTFYTNGGFVDILSEEFSNKMAGYIRIG